MNTTTARRYAKALFDLARPEKQLDPIRERMERMDALIRTQPELLDLCRNPVYSLEEKKRVLASMADRIESPPLLRRFTELLLQKNRFRQLPEIVKVFGALVDEAEGREHVRVRTAVALSSEETVSLRKRLETILRRSVDLNLETDPSLIGGLIVHAAGRVYDGSVKGRLQGLRRELVK